MSKEYECNICEGYITPEHGGIVCKRCGSVFCCDSRCISPTYLSGPISQSQGIDFCPLCKDDPRIDNMVEVNSSWLKALEKEVSKLHIRVKSIKTIEKSEVDYEIKRRTQNIFNMVNGITWNISKEK